MENLDYTEAKLLKEFQASLTIKEKAIARAYRDHITEGVQNINNQDRLRFNLMMQCFIEGVRYGTKHRGEIV